MNQTALAKLLKTENISMPLDELLGLVRGVQAAPVGTDPNAWIRLITPNPSSLLVRALNGLLKEMNEKKEPDESPETRLLQLRRVLKKNHVDGFLIPRADEYQGEYVPAYAQRLAWLTGFTGSAGTAVVLKDRAAVFVDGRYTLQAENQINLEQYEIVSIGETSIDSWMKNNVHEGQNIAFDPKLHTRTAIKSLQKICASKGAQMVSLQKNPLDSIWIGQPPPPISPAIPHKKIYAGMSLKDKCDKIAANISEKGADAVVITMTDSIAWLLNLRGGDVEFTPLPLSFAILHKDASAELFIDKRKMNADTVSHLGNRVSIHSKDDFAGSLNSLRNKSIKIQIDPSTASEWVYQQALGGTSTILEATDPCSLPKAIKNTTELSGSKAAHLRDGAALTKFLHWLSETSLEGSLTELEASDKLEEYRQEGEYFRGLSFPTIAGAGEHGAIVHYRVDDKSNRQILPGELFLVDSGAQYLDGTTDVTRTVAIGSPSKEMEDRFTRVLKGHIAIATAVFPVGTTGGQLDTLARKALWEVGLDYDHGTGHGVGSFLSVHEGPHRISKGFSTAPLQPGMIVSNEPGYYKTNEYGIRIENLVTVVPDQQPERGELDMLQVETLTLAPIDLRLISRDLLTQDEKNWVNAYHARVRNTLSPLLPPNVAKWLQICTEPIQ